MEDIKNYPVLSEKKVKTDGTVVNGADGINSDGSRNVKLAGIKAKVVYANLDQVLNIATASNSTITVTPPVGELWRIKLLTVTIPKPVGGGTGNHELYMRLGVNSSFTTVLGSRSDFNNDITISANVITSTSVSETPTGDQLQQNAILNMVVTNESPLFLYITNSTGVTQSNTATIRMIREVEYIV